MRRRNRHSGKSSFTSGNPIRKRGCLHRYSPPLIDLQPIKNDSDQPDDPVSPTLAKPISVRVSPNSYLIACLVGTFFSGFFLFLEIDLAGLVLLLISWVTVPLLAFTDRIVFDGKRLTRTGILARVWTAMNGSRRRLRLSDIEIIETQSIRALKRGGNVYYRYRTSIRGREMIFAFASGGDGYRQMIGRILPLVPESVLDNRSIELRDYLADPKDVLMKAAFAKIPDADVLESSFSRTRKNSKAESETLTETGQPDIDKAEYLQRLGNELRLMGRLHQALESFRRALVLKPMDARLIFDFALCLNSFAGAERDQRLGLRSIAAMRLAERRARTDGDLLERVGEAYFQLGEWRRAGKAFQTVLDHGESFLAARGMAEIALREGKLAHVIHQFSTANRLAENNALRRYTRGEADYFARLNNDDEYMELEVGRVNLLESLEGGKKTVLRIAAFGFAPLILGLVVEDELLSHIGWAVTAIALLIWTALIIAVRFLSPRIPYELIDHEE